MLVKIEGSDGTVREVDLTRGDGFSVGLAEPGLVRFAVTSGDQGIALFIRQETAVVLCKAITDAFISEETANVSRH